MIEVLLLQTGDRAYADTPENAVYAARELAEDADTGTTRGFRPRAIFLVDGVAVRECDVHEL